ncbi:MAG: tyrosine-type recombinase/integrase [Aminivibrio sp.]
MEFLATYENPSSYNLRFAYLKVFWDWLIAEGFFRGSRHPLAGLTKRRPQGRIVQLEEKEVARLLEQPDQRTYAGLRDYAAMMLQVDTGIRPGELLQLMQEDYRPEKEGVTIRAPVSKTRTSRTLPISPPTVSAINKLLIIRPSSWGDVPIFCTYDGRPFSVREYSRRIKEYGKKCGLDITSYSLRHAAALLLLRRGADAFTVQALLGHSTMQMTRHYVNLTNEDTRRGHNKAGVIRSILGEEVTPKNKRMRRL